MSETSERPWVKGDRFTIPGIDDVFEVATVLSSGVHYQRNNAPHYAFFGDMRRVDPPEPVGDLMETEHGGKRWREIQGERGEYVEGTLTVLFEAVPLNLDDFARIGWEAHRKVTGGLGTPWDDCSAATRYNHRVAIDAVLDAVGHVLPEEPQR